MRCITVLLSLAAIISTATAQVTEFREAQVAGSPHDLMMVRHLVIRGDNFSIGKKLAELAISRHHSRLGPLDPKVAPSQAQWLSGNYPERVQRARGVAAAYGVAYMQGSDPTSVPFDLDLKPGCSVVYYPGSSVKNHHAMLSRNYDFPKARYAELRGQEAPAGARSMTGDPYVIEMYPDQGFASLYTCAYDLVGGAIDGVNAKGVTVALLADDMSKTRTRGRVGYGLSEVDLPRFVLDHCATAQEARQALKELPYYSTFVPCHYIIGDAGGDSFIFEVGQDGRHYMIPGSGKPQIVTNHSIAEYGTTGLPEGNSFDRYRRLQAELVKRKGKVSPADVKEINYCVAVPSGVRVAATMWHAVYDLQLRSVQISFCLSGPDEQVERRTPYLTFALKGPGAHPGSSSGKRS
jgi:hypothetical protein